MAESATDEANRKMVEKIKRERQNFLDTLVNNADGSITISRTGKVLRGEFESGGGVSCFDLPDGIPQSDGDCIGNIARDLGYKAGEEVDYTITVQPKPKA